LLKSVNRKPRMMSTMQPDGRFVADGLENMTPKVGVEL
jgi:hypothetical protein